jgi:IS30 family transposase
MTGQSRKSTMTYKHLTREERYQIYALHRQGVSLAVIAAELMRSRSTITRELKRNAGPKGYRPAKAHERACGRQSARRNARQFDEQHWAQVHSYLDLKLSPEQVSGRLKAEGTMSISHECIYLHIYADKRAGGQLARGLRCQKARRKRYGSGQERRGTLKDRVSIELRPAIVDERSRIGDWEGDTIVGKGHQGVLLTLVERKSRYTLARQSDSRHSAGVTEAVIALLRPYKSQCQTITFDNGKEFAEHAFIASSLQADVYFAHPYHSWERGLNENTNGLLRQYFPKACNLRKVTQHEVDEALYELNHRPRKCLQYRTPHEVFMGLEMRPLH